MASYRLIICCHGCNEKREGGGRELITVLYSRVHDEQRVKVSKYFWPLVLSIGGIIRLQGTFRV